VRKRWRRLKLLRQISCAIQDASARAGPISANELS
jgi:hypothetical protein